MEGALQTTAMVAAIGSAQLAFFVPWLGAIGTAEERGLDTSALGWIAGLPWAAAIVGLLVAPALARRFGAKAVAAGALLLHTVAAGAMIASEGGTLVLPLVALGLGLGARWVAMDVWLVSATAPIRIGRMLGLAETVAGAAMVAAPSLASLAGQNGHDTLGYATLAICATTALLLPWRIPIAPPRDPSPEARRDPRDRERIGPLPLAASFLGGSLEAGFMGAVLLFSADGADTREGTIAATAVALGSLAAQVFWGAAADRSGWRVPLQAACATVIASLAVAMLVPESMAIAALGVGAGGGALYTLAVIAAVRASGEPARAVALCAIAYTAGTFAAGPATGTAIAMGGPVLALLGWALATAALLRLAMTRSRSSA